jgi:Cu/Ag efflux protein CusF
MQPPRLPHRRHLLLLPLGVALASVWWPLAAGAARLGEEHLTSLRGAATGTVTAVDVAGRRLTVRGPLAENSYRVDPKVKTLETITVGSTVRVDYVAGIGLTLRRGPGAKPVAPAAGAASGKTTTIITRVVAVDTAGQKIRLQGPQGETGEFPVEDKASLVGVKTGDQLEAKVYELVAVEVLPAGK